MRDVASAIREGAEAFLATQYSAIPMHAPTSCVLLFLLYLADAAVGRHLDVRDGGRTAATSITGAPMSAAYVRGHGPRCAPRAPPPPRCAA